MPAPLNTNLCHVAIIGGAGFLGRHIAHALQTYSTRSKTTHISVLDLHLNPDKPVEHYPLYKGPAAGSSSTANNTTNPKDEKASSTSPASSSTTTSPSSSSSSPRQKEPIPISFHACDITNLASLTALLDELRPDVVFHTASPHADAPRPVLERVNVEGTANVIEACRVAGLAEDNNNNSNSNGNNKDNDDHGEEERGRGRAGSSAAANSKSKAAPIRKKPRVRILVYTSSASVVFDAARKKPAGLVNADERWPVVRGKAQSEFYTDTKARAEALVLDANNAPLTPSNPPINPSTTSDSTSGLSSSPSDSPGQGKLLTCALRPAGIFGEHDGQLLPNLLLAHRRGQTRFQVGSNTNLFDFTYAGNVAWGHLLAAAALLGTFNAGQTNKMNKTNKATAEDEKDGINNSDDEEKSANNSQQKQATSKTDDLIVAGEAFFLTNASPVPFYDFCRAVWMACSTGTNTTSQPQSPISNLSNPNRPKPSTVTSRVETKSDPLDATPIQIPTALALFLASIAEFLFALYSLIGGTSKKPNLTRQRVWFSTVTRYYSVEKARRRLGYEPVVGLAEGVRRGVGWLLWEEGEREKMKMMKD